MKDVRDIRKRRRRSILNTQGSQSPTFLILVSGPSGVGSWTSLRPVWGWGRSSWPAASSRQGWGTWTAQSQHHRSNMISFSPWLSTVPSERGLINKWIKGPSQDRCWLGWPVVLVHVLEGVPWLLLEAVDRLFAVPDGPWEGELPPQPVFVHSTCNMVSQSTIALAFIVNNDNILIYLF